MGKVLKEEKKFLNFLKFLSKFINKEKTDSDIILKLSEKYNISENFLLSKIISHFYNKPKVIWYINKYMNDYFIFNKYDFKNILDSLLFIIYNMTDTKSLYFIKSNENKDYKREEKIEEIEKYILAENPFYVKNRIELIQLSSIFFENQHSNNEELKNNDEEEKIKEYLDFIKTRPLGEEIHSFCNELKKMKLSSNNCKKCPLNEKPMVVLDTNLEKVSKCDIMFVALNPGKDEVVFNKPLVGASGKLFREKMYKIKDYNVKWVITNTMLCATNNQNDIGKAHKKVLEVARHCSNFLNKLIETFNPSVIVPIGKVAIDVFDLECSSIVDCCGKIIKKDNRLFVPLIHPSAVIQSRSLNTPVFEKGWEIIYSIFDKFNVKNSNVVENNISAPGIVNEKEKERNLTYLDTIIINSNEIINLFIDENGKKVYIKEELKYPIYIKKGRPTNVEDKFDYICVLNNHDRYNLIKELKDNLKKHKLLMLSKT